ncbi:MAG: archease [Patescibacteria group bacterium]|nr:archease [Patescibacteria group bacterium]
MFQLLPHTADIKFKIISKNLKGLIKESLKAINFYLKPKIIKKTNPSKAKIILNYKNEVELLIDYLSKILIKTYVEKKLFRVSKCEILEGKVKIELIGFKFESLTREIKAITYHQANISKDRNKIIFEFIADV